MWFLILVGMTVSRLTSADVLVTHSVDFDGDGVIDELDLDQDNDGILNSDEGYISFANLASYPADSFVLLPGIDVTADDTAVNQTSGSVFRYPLLNHRGVPSLEFAGTLVQTDTRVDWAVQQQLPKFRHVGAGRSEVHWQFLRFGTDEQVLVNVDLTIADLDGNRSESVTIDTTDIAGYSVSMDTNLLINDAVPGKLIVTAGGKSDNTENDALVLHLRNVSELNVTYRSLANSNVVPELRNDAAGFRHNFTAGALANYIPFPKSQHTDSDSYPDHQDLDRDNDGVPDASISVDKNRDGMVDGPVDANGVPTLEVSADNENADIIEPMGGQSLDGTPQPTDGQIAEVLPVEDPSNTAKSSLSNATLNFVSDLDRDSIADSVEGLGDADGDGVPNQYDLDSDNDGLPDLIEAGAIDTDNNGVVDDAAGSSVKTYTTIVPDFDKDGLPDFLDTDSDQDSLFDLVEAGGEDLDANGTIDGLIDRNGDGWDDRLMNAPLPLPDHDADGNPDTLDTDRNHPTAVVLEGFQQLDDEVAIDSNIATGVNGAAGCVLKTGQQALDPMLWVLLVVLQFHYWSRRVLSSCRDTTDAHTQYSN